jgi:hypothetical protein
MADGSCNPETRDAFTTDPEVGYSPIVPRGYKRPAMRTACGRPHLFGKHVGIWFRVCRKRRCYRKRIAKLVTTDIDGPGNGNCSLVDRTSRFHSWVRHAQKEKHQNRQ